MRRHAAPWAILAVLASCQSIEALGRALERTAYPAGGAVAGAALGGPPGAAGGAAVGHLLGESVVHDGGAGSLTPTATEVVAEQARITTEAILWHPILGAPLFLWVILAVLVAWRAPWLPGLVWGKIVVAFEERAERSRGPR